MCSGFRCAVDENSALLGYYAASSGKLLPKIRDNLSVPNLKGPLKMEPIVYPERSVINHHYSLLYNPEDWVLTKNVFFNLVQNIKNKSFLPNPAIHFAARTDKHSGKKEQGFSTSLWDDIRNRLAPELFFLILAHPVYKMWIIQEPNT